jgi:hypothetical protein
VNGHDGGDREKAGLKQHPTDVVSLVFGLVFLVLAGWWLVDLLAGVVLPLGWLLAGTLIVIGAIGLFAAVRSSRRDRGTDPHIR